MTPSNHNFMIKPKYPSISGGSSAIRHHTHHDKDHKFMKLNNKVKGIFKYLYNYNNIKTNTTFSKFTS